MKKLTVIGMIGNTQGVSRAAKPQRIAARIMLHSEPEAAPAALLSCAGASPSCRVKLSSKSGVQLFSSQAIHSTVISTWPLPRTFWEKVTSPSK